MTASRSAGLVRRWVELYTRGLSADVGGRRTEEIEADLWSQFEEATLVGRSERSVSGEILVRLIAGAPADISWRLAHRAGDPLQSSVHTIATSGSLVLGGLAIAGGLSFGIGLVLLAVTVALPLFVAVSLGMIAMGIATAILVLRFQDRINGAVGLVGSVGSMGAILGAMGPWTMTFLLPVGSSAVVWNLALLGVLGRRLAAAHVLSAVAYLVLMAVIVTGTSPGIAFVLLLPYPITWVAIGASISRGRPATEPAPHA